MLNTAYEDDERPSEPDPARNAVHGDTILFLGCQDLDEAYSYLVARGVKAETRQRSGPDGMGRKWTRSTRDWVTACAFNGPRSPPEPAG